MKLDFDRLKYLNILELDGCFMFGTFLFFHLSSIIMLCI